jgi:hypothetical protein
VCERQGSSAGELLVVGDQPGDPLEQRPGVGAFAVHRAVLIQRAGDSDEGSLVVSRITVSVSPSSS